MFFVTEHAAATRAKRERNALLNRFAHNPEGELRASGIFLFFPL